MSGFTWAAHVPGPKLETQILSHVFSRSRCACPNHQADDNKWRQEHHRHHRPNRITLSPSQHNDIDRQRVMPCTSLGRQTTQRSSPDKWSWLVSTGSYPIMIHASLSTMVKSKNSCHTSCKSLVPLLQLLFWQVIISHSLSHSQISGLDARLTYHGAVASVCINLPDYISWGRG